MVRDCFVSLTHLYIKRQQIKLSHQPTDLGRATFMAAFREVCPRWGQELCLLVCSTKKGICSICRPDTHHCKRDTNASAYYRSAQHILWDFTATISSHTLINSF